MEVRRLTDLGIAEFDRLLAAARVAENPSFVELRDSAVLTQPVEGGGTVEPQPFTSRYELAGYLSGALAGVANDRDRGMWSWLAVAWVDILAPVRADGTRRFGERARWILASDDYRRYYRHLLAGPYAIYRSHADEPQRALALLATPVGMPGDVAEQFASRQEIVTNASLVSLITRLYFDPSTGRLRSGAGGKGPGSARRLADVLLQLDLTWDIYGMPAAGIRALLPNEFDAYGADTG
jgi:hypothetical protein